MKTRPQTTACLGVKKHLPVNLNKSQTTLTAAFFREVYGVDVNSHYRSWILSILLKYPNIYFSRENIQEIVDNEYHNVKMRYKLSDEDYFSTIDYISDFVEIVTALGNYVHLVKIKENVHTAYTAFIKGVYAEISLDS
jgi:hypothetical protein